MSAGDGGILANTFYRGIADLGSKIASIALFIVMARELGPSQFGIFTFALAFVTIVTALADFGQDAVLTREVARDRSLVRDYFANTLALKATLALPSLALATAVVGLTGSDGRTQTVVLLLGVAIVAELLTHTSSAVFQGYERLVYIPIVLITQRFVTAIAGITALKLEADVVAVSALYLAGSVVGLALSLVLLARYVWRPVPVLEPRRWPLLMRAAVPIGLAGVFGTVLFRVDAAMLTWFESDRVVGLYGGAYRLFESTLFLGWAVGAALYPVLSRLVGDAKGSSQVFARGIKLALVLSLPFAVGAGVLAEPLVTTLYGASFEDAGRSLQLLAPTIVLYPLSYLALTLLVAQRRHRFVTIVLGLVAVENVLANLVLIPWLSLEGAALGTTISQLLVTTALWRGTGELVGRLELRRLASPVLGAILAAAAMAALSSSLAAAALVGGIVYLAALLLFERVAFPEDTAAALALLRRRRL